MKEILEYWKEDEFIRYDKKKLSELEFKNETIEFLCTVGLMKGERFNNRSSLRFLAEFEEITIANEKYIRIASPTLGSEGLYIKIKEDHVYYIDLPDEHNELYKSFCNTKIHDYVNFEIMKFIIASKYPNVDDDELEGYECAREVIEEFKKIDSEAVYPYSYWANRMLNYAIDYFYDEDEKFEAAIKSGKYASRNDAYFDVLFNGMHVLET